MDSLTKISLRKSQLEKLVGNAFGPSVKLDSYYELKDGWFNTIYSLSLNDKKEIILKISPPKEVKILRYEKDIMKTEVEVSRLLKTKGEVPVPEVLFYDNTGMDIENEYFMMEKISGQAYSKIKDSLSSEEKKLIETELGMYNRLINNIKSDRFGNFSHPEKAADNWFDAFHMMISDILLDGKEYEIKLPLEYNEIEELICSRIQFFKSVNEASLVHWDLHDGNVIIDNNLHIAGIIDCDRALWGDPLIEVYFGDFFNSADFKAGYGCDPMSASDGIYRRSFYNLYLYLIMYIESFYRGYDEGHKKWTYNLLDNEIKKLFAF